MELKALQQQLSDVCYRQASQLEFRQNLLQAALEFHSVAQDVSCFTCHRLGFSLLLVYYCKCSIHWESLKGHKT